MNKEAIRQFFSYLGFAGVLINTLSGWFDWSNTVRYISMAVWTIGLIGAINQLMHWHDNSRSNNIINIIIMMLMTILLEFSGK
jgi:hypothetical protein